MASGFVLWTGDNAQSLVYDRMGAPYILRGRELTNEGERIGNLLRYRLRERGSFAAESYKQYENAPAKLHTTLRWIAALPRLRISW